MGIDRHLLQQIVSGLATGGIYASLALALVMIYRATEIVNFAQGEMAMFSTYLAWSMLNAGAPYWVAFFATVVLAFAGGFLIERIVIRPIEGKPVLTLVIVCIGLLVILNSLAGWITRTASAVPEPPSPDGRSASARWCSAQHDLGVIGVTLVLLCLLYAFFRFTSSGSRCVPRRQNPASSRLCGIRVGWMLALGWGLAALVGSVAGMLVAPVIFLEPNMMGGILIYAFAGGELGGITSPLGP